MLKVILKRIRDISVVLFYEIAPIIGKGISRKKIYNNKIIVSLTSYPKRFSKLHLAIKSVMLQSVKPDKIILYLDMKDKDKELPYKLKSLEKKGLEIIWTAEELKPHKKYFHVMQQYPNDIIITVDDDMIYERNMIKLLIESYKKYPNAVSAKRVHRMYKNKEGEIDKYNNWGYEYSDITVPSMELFATGVGGVLYPPKCMDERLFDIESIREKCMNADDVWLKYMQILNNTPVVFVKGKRILPLIVAGTQEVNLHSQNVIQNMNDIYIENLRKEFNVDLKDYCSNICDK